MLKHLRYIVSCREVNDSPLIWGRIVNLKHLSWCDDRCRQTYFSCWSPRTCRLDSGRADGKKKKSNSDPTYNHLLLKTSADNWFNFQHDLLDFGYFNNWMFLISYLLSSPYTQGCKTGFYKYNATPNKCSYYIETVTCWIIFSVNYTLGLNAL